MSQAMLSMMDAMGNLAQDYNRNKGWSSGSFSQPYNSWQGMNYSPWGMTAMPGGGIPGQQQIQGLMTQAPTAPQGMASGAPLQFPAPQQSPLDGIWQGQGGEMVLVMYGHFRIYANADAYRDGRYEVRDDRLIMVDPETGAKRSFEFALSEGRLVLRDQDGRLLLFRQLPIPVPPYTLFYGQQPISTHQQTDADQD
ncbi:MAG: hypothetical protein ABFS39_14285 [Pseudomonadota bacterium]